MQTHLRLLFAIADGEHARFVRPSEDHSLHSQSHIVSRTGRDDKVLWGDKLPAASYQPQSSTHHPMTPRHDLHTMEKENFADWVATQLNEAALEGMYDDLVLVAPPNIMDALSRTLGQTASAKIIGKLEKDLAKVPDSELWPHLREWVRPVHRQTKIT
jgi:protein required for attachment to host cells